MQDNKILAALPQQQASMPLSSEIDHEKEWAAWSQCYHERLEREKTKKEKPFMEHIAPLLEKLAQTAKEQGAVYEKAHENRARILSAWSERVKAHLHSSTKIPAYCGLSNEVFSLEARTPEIAQVFAQADTGRNVFITGGVGAGKTYAAVQMLYRWCRKNFRYGFETSVYQEVRSGVKPLPCILNFYEYEQSRRVHADFPRFVNVKNFLYEIKKTFDGAGNEEGVMEKYLKTPMLVFDDFGAEKASDWTREKVLTLLEMRLYDKKKQTVITSNLSLAQVAEKIDDRIASRLVEKCVCVTLRGRDLRLGGAA